MTSQDKIKLEVGKIYRNKGNPIKQRKEVLALTDEWVVYNDRANDTEGEGTIVRNIAEQMWVEAPLEKSFIVYEQVSIVSGHIYLGSADGQELNILEGELDDELENSIMLGRSWVFDPETKRLFFQHDANAKPSFPDPLKTFPGPIPFTTPLVPGYIPSQPGFNPGEVICRGDEGPIEFSCSSIVVNEENLKAVLEEDIK